MSTLSDPPVPPPYTPPANGTAPVAPPLAPSTGAPVIDAPPPFIPPDAPVAPAQDPAAFLPISDAQPVAPAAYDPAASPFIPTVLDQQPHAADAEEAARLDAVNLSMWFGERKVLERCSLSMEPGRVTALIGPSGCGKSTFLRALNRMHELVPTAALAGQILLNGEDIYSEDVSPTEVRMRIGMVFQKPNPFPAMSIADNVLAGLGLSGTSTPDPEALVEQCLRRAGLWEEVKDRLHEGGMSLSGGQQQRLCIARSLAVHPDVLLMDEPCSALDPISTRVIEETIRELCEDITIVIVTHNMQQAQRVSDDCAFFLVEEMRKPGRIVESGPTDRLFSDPHDPRTLDYVTGRFG